MNFKSGSPSSNIPQTDEEALKHISQERYIQRMYKGYRKIGMSIPQAMLRVLEMTAREEGSDG